MSHTKYEDPPEIFRGPLDECLRHLGAALEAGYPANSKGSAQARQPLADFCGVGLPTVARWLKGEAPTGLSLIKIVCYLQLFGYRVMDYSRVKPARRRFAELIGFGVLEAEEAATLIGYSDVPWLYAVLRGTQGSSDAKEAAMSDAWLSYRAELDAKKIEARERYKLDIRFKTRAGGEAVMAATLSSMECLAALLDAGAAERIVEMIGEADRRRIAALSESLYQRLSELATDLSIPPTLSKGG
jgi:hypothetical protein